MKGEQNVKLTSEVVSVSVNLDVTTKIFLTSQALKIWDVFLQKGSNLFSQYHFVYQQSRLLEIENQLEPKLKVTSLAMATISVKPC